jgi:hypothetical protein
LPGGITQKISGFGLFAAGNGEKPQKSLRLAKNLTLVRSLRAALSDAERDVFFSMKYCLQA